MATRKGKKNSNLAGGSEDNDKELAALLFSNDPKIIEMQKKITQIFNMYDQGGQKMIDIRSAGSMFHAMGLMPTQVELNDIITDIEDMSAKGYVKYERMAPYITKILVDGKLYQPPEEDLIRECFEVFDKEQLGTIDPQKLKDCLMREGEVLTPDEFEKMMNCGVEAVDSLFHYEEYMEKANRHLPKKDDLKVRDSDEDVPNTLNDTPQAQ